MASTTYIEDRDAPGVKLARVLATAENVDFSASSVVALPSGTTVGGTSLSLASLGSITAATSTAFTVASTASNYGLQIDESTGSAVTGLKIKAAATGNGIALSALGGTNEPVYLDGKGTGAVLINSISTTSGLVTLGNATSVAGVLVNGPTTITSASALSLAIGPNGATTPLFSVDSSTGSAVTGLKVTGAVTTGTVAVAVTQTSGNANLTIDAKGTGTVGINTVGTGAGLVTIGNTTSVAGVFVNGPLQGMVKVAASSGNTTLTAAKNNYCVLFDTASGNTFTLPAPVVGQVYDFIVSVSVTSNSHKIITNSGSVYIQGGLAVMEASGATNLMAIGDGTANVAITMNGSTTGGLKGTSIRLVAISSTVWQAQGLVVGSGTLATPFANS
jgi:hypothetical protein